MPRHHMTSEGPVPFTPKEELDWDTAQNAWAAEAGNRIRAVRNQRLVETDWSQGVDVPKSIQMKFSVYRQALRNIPQKSGFPNNIEWPVAPVA